MTRPRVIYEAKPGSPLDVDRALYERLAGEAGTRSLVERFVVPRRSGRAWPVRAGQLFRIVAAEGPQPPRAAAPCVPPSRPGTARPASTSPSPRPRPPMAVTG